MGTAEEMVDMLVLVVEDEKRIAAALKRGLEGEGFAVDVALSGTEGLWFATENAYDAIVLDLMLPGINGYKICSQLREAGNWTPILMLTAKAGELDHAEALDTGADDYLTKPFSFVVLLAHLRALLRRSGPAQPTLVHELGDLRLEPASHRAWVAEEEINLTAREFSVLECLMRQPGQVVSKSELLANVWDFNFAGDPNIVEVYIRRLRRKLDDPFGRHTIDTVRGAGYRMDPDQRRDCDRHRYASEQPSVLWSWSVWPSSAGPPGWCKHTTAPWPATWKQQPCSAPTTSPQHWRTAPSAGCSPPRSKPRPWCRSWGPMAR
jgi:two-component system OmpR family response regulator